MCRPSASSWRPTAGSNICRAMLRSERCARWSKARRSCAASFSRYQGAAARLSEGRHMRLFRTRRSVDCLVLITSIAISSFCMAVAGARAQSALLDDRVVKVTDAAKVEAARSPMVRHIWGTDWASVLAKRPNSVDRNYAPTALDALPGNLANLQRIDRLDVTTAAPITTSGAKSVESKAFVFHPSGSPKRVV